MGSPCSIGSPGEPPWVRINRSAFGGSAERNVEDNVLSVPPPFGNQAHDICELYQNISAGLGAALDNHGYLWKRMAVGEDESLSYS